MIHLVTGRGAGGGRSLQCLPIALVLTMAACRDATVLTPSGHGSPDAARTLEQVAQDSTPDQLDVARVVPGFGGYFFDESGAPTAYLTDPSRRPEAERALAGFLASRGFAAADLRVRHAEYDYLQLDGWYRSGWPRALAVTGAVFSDLDEGRNRLRFGAVDAAAVAAVARALALLAIPTTAIIVERAAPIKAAATLRDRARPVHGGYQIDFFASPASPVSLVCTLGFNAVKDGRVSFITNSHCSNVQGGTETPTDYYQPSRGFVADPDNFVGVEADDPPYDAVNCDTPGFRCRYSDAARAEYASGVTSDLGRIARPAAQGGTLEVDPANPFFIIVGEQADPVQGEVANKVGRTTGWTAGPVEATCINTIVLGTNIMQRCQSVVRAGVAGGDSGSPVFSARAGSDVVLLGILWGSSGSGAETTFVFSPMSGIERELGALQTF